MCSSNHNLQFSTGKLEGKHPYGKPKIRWEDNIIWNLKEVGYEGDRKELVLDKVTWHVYVLAAMNLRIS